MTRKKYISHKSKKAATLFLLLHFVFSPIITAIPNMDCDGECSSKITGTCEISSHTNENNIFEENNSCCGCCAKAESPQNTTDKNKEDGCDLQFHSSKCELNSDFKSFDFTITVKYEQKANFTPLATINETGERFSLADFHFSIFGNAKSPPIYISNSSFLI